MSLYAIGVIFSGNAKAIHETQNINLTNIDKKDVETIIEEVRRVFPNINTLTSHPFAIVDDESSASATSLWNVARERCKETPLSIEDADLLSILIDVVNTTSSSIGAVGLFDGSIESTFISNKEGCIRYMSRLVEARWDNMENPIIIWSD